MLRKLCFDMCWAVSVDPESAWEQAELAKTAAELERTKVRFCAVAPRWTYVLLVRVGAGRSGQGECRDRKAEGALEICNPAFQTDPLCVATKVLFIRQRLRS